MSDKARIAAYNAVIRISNGAYSNLLTSFDGLEGLDRAFAESIALGTLERKITLEHIISKLIQKETKHETVALLMTGIYQILYMNKVPENAACDETVKIAKELFGKSAGGFVNAVMRNTCRKKDEILSDIDNSDGYIRFSANKELFELLKNQYPNDIERIFSSFFGKEPTFLRVNTLKADAKKVAAITDGEIISEKTVICTNTAKAVSAIKNGDFYIQGLASQRAVELLGAKPMQTVIDICACPGGKTLGAAIDMENKGRIFAFDLHANKLSLIKKSSERLGISIITAEKQDGRKAREDLIGTADRVICDVPCSGTGVMGSKPEIKYKSPKDFEPLYKTQRAILETASGYLKIGGEIVYSTCSINKNENEQNIRAFLENHSDFSLVFEKTCLPFEEEREGFYMAKLKREK